MDNLNPTQPQGAPASPEAGNAALALHQWCHDLVICITLVTLPEARATALTATMKKMFDSKKNVDMVKVLEDCKPSEVGARGAREA